MYLSLLGMHIKMMPFIFFIFLTVTLLFLFKVLNLKVLEAVQLLVYFAWVLSGQILDISSYYIFSYFCFVTVVVCFLYFLNYGLNYTLDVVRKFARLLFKLILVNVVLIFFIYIFTLKISSVFTLISITSLLQLICGGLFIMMIKVYMHCRLKQEDKMD